MIRFTDSRQQAIDLDAQDPLKGLRSQFFIPVDADGTQQLYFAGNSLGLQPKRAHDYVLAELEDWKRHGVEGHFHARRPWMPYHKLLTPMAAELVGAKAGEVVHMNTLTVNLHLMMVSFYRPTQSRFKIVIEQPAFPSDRYAVVSQLGFHGYDADDALIEIAPRPGETQLRDSDIERIITEQGQSIALVLLPGVQYYSGQLLDMPRITQLAHEQGCLVGFDLAHAAGNVPLNLHDWDVDFASWCTYKYLNAGPGAIAGCFVHERFATDQSLRRFSGWWGHDQAIRFQMGPDFIPMPGAEGWQLSNPPILSLAPVLASLELFNETGMAALCEKSRQLTCYLDWLIEKKLSEHIQVITPKMRGCQLSLRLRQANRGRELQAALIERNIICDWREPDVIRIAPVPSYNRFIDVWLLVDNLCQLLTHE